MSDGQDDGRDGLTIDDDTTCELATRIALALQMLDSRDAALVLSIVMIDTLMRTGPHARGNLEALQDSLAKMFDRAERAMHAYERAKTEGRN